MKKVLYLFVLLVVLPVFSIGFVSCESKAKKQERIEAQKQEQQRQREEEQKRLEEERVNAAKAKEEAKVMEAWNYLLNSGVVKSPYSAHLNGYIITDDGNVILELDSQNGFGAMLRGRCVVIYKDGKPVFADGL